MLIIQAYLTPAKAFRVIFAYMFYNFIFPVKKLFMGKNFVLFMLFPHPLENDRHIIVINKYVNHSSLLLLIQLFV